MALLGGLSTSPLEARMQRYAIIPTPSIWSLAPQYWRASLL